MPGAAARPPSPVMMDWEATMLASRASTNMGQNSGVGMLE